MRFCTQCGAQVKEGEFYCSYCGTKIESPQSESQENNNQPKEIFANIPNYENRKLRKNSSIDILIKVFLIISCLYLSLFFVPLFWCIPLTVVVWKKLNNNEYIGTGTKICILLFVSMLSGILLLVRNDESNEDNHSNNTSIDL